MSIQKPQPTKTAPPLTFKISPVIKLAIGEAKNNIGQAISSAEAARPTGISPIYLGPSADIIVSWLMSVSTQPGATQLTIILYGANSGANDLVNEIRAPFVAA